MLGASVGTSVTSASVTVFKGRNKTMRSSDTAKGSMDFAKTFHGSHDQQIGQSAHDEIVLWLYEKLNDQEFIFNNLDLSRDYKIKKIYRTIEQPLFASYRSGSKPGGFIDLAMRAEIVKEDDADIDRHYRFHRLFEVKTSVNIGETIRQIRYYSGLGAGYADDKWYVCAPDFASKNILIEQGIGFIPYEP